MIIDFDLISGTFNDFVCHNLSFVTDVWNLPDRKSRFGEQYQS